ncbi:MAG: 2-oxo acid dehydrogenase subunit E2 [Caldilineaceae bacterium]|nr:2-oxo acid dehydrogenase subunit E2 [Caldilineaceae bacterium]
MSTEIVMPNLGFDVQQARLIEWLKQPGDPIQKGEVIAVVESDKANVELESIAGGVVLEQLVAAGVEVPVGAVLARVGPAGEPTQANRAAAVAASALAIERPAPVESSPIARKLAADHGIDLATVAGSGPRGRVTKEDVEAAIAQSASGAPTGGTGVRALPKVRQAARSAGVKLANITPTGRKGEVTMTDLRAQMQPAEAAPAVEAEAAPAGGQAIPLSRIRQVIGKRLGESKREAPHFYVTGEFDLEAALGRLKAMPAPQPGINDLIQYVAVQALRRAPALNATFQHDTLYRFDAINLAIAVARDEGLITPVLHGAERFSLAGLAQESRKLIERARANKLQPDDLQGGTFTISNLGVIRQVDQFVAIINPPQVAILAVGAVKQRPVVIDGGLHIRHTVHVTLSGDHRAVDGLDLGLFMAAFQAELDNVR